MGRAPFESKTFIGTIMFLILLYTLFFAGMAPTYGQEIREAPEYSLINFNESRDSGSIATITEWHRLVLPDGEVVFVYITWRLDGVELLSTDIVTFKQGAEVTYNGPYIDNIKSDLAKYLLTRSSGGPPSN